VTLQRAIGAAVLCGLLLLAKVAGAADALTLRDARLFGDAAERALASAGAPCDGGVRTVAVVAPGTVDVVCGYSQAYRVTFTGPHDATVKRLAY
jgi:hypothetical protein